MTITQEQLDAWEAQHKRIAYVPGPDDPKTGQPEWEVAFRKPTFAEFEMYKKNALNPAVAFKAQLFLARQLVISTDLASFDKLLQEYPGIPEGCSAQINRLCGVATAETAK